MVEYHYLMAKTVAVAEIEPNLRQESCQHVGCKHMDGLRNLLNVFITLIYIHTMPNISLLQHLYAIIPT